MSADVHGGAVQVSLGATETLWCLMFLVGGGFDSGSELVFKIALQHLCPPVPVFVVAMLSSWQASFRFNVLGKVPQSYAPVNCPCCVLYVWTVPFC